MSQERIGRYRVTRRVKETPFEARGDDGAPSASGGSRLVCEAARQGDDAPRRLYVVRIEESDTREILADAFLACTALKHEHVVALLDAGTFGDRVYAAMSLDGAISLARLVDAIDSLEPLERRAAILATIGADVAAGIQAGHDLGGRGLIHDALDLDSIFVDRTGRALVDPAFLDPWIANETIAATAAPFASPDRWMAPCANTTERCAKAAWSSSTS